MLNNQEPGSSSSTTTTTTSKSVKEDSPTYTASPVAENNEKSSRTEADHLNNGAMNTRDRPPRATTAKNNMHRLRSASARVHKYGSSQAYY